jgi:hypothetical protein
MTRQSVRFEMRFKKRRVLMCMKWAYVGGNNNNSITWTWTVDVVFKASVMWRMQLMSLNSTKETKETKETVHLC